MTRLTLIAVAGYLTGLTIGTAACAIGWALTSGEHRYAIPRRTR